MGQFSQLAKSCGYIVSMAPAESYVDPTISGFDRSLLHEYEEWKNRIPPFAYHGRNCYAYLLAKYGTSIFGSEENMKRVDTFDFVTIQFYEGYSHAEFYISVQKIPPKDYLTGLIFLVLQFYFLRNNQKINFWVGSTIRIGPGN